MDYIIYNVFCDLAIWNADLFTLLQDVVLIAYLGEPLKCQLKCHSCLKLALSYSSNNGKGFI